jgi:cyanobactin maturation PatA/PatG family protease
VVIPIFQSDGRNGFRPMSQLDLARAITQAMMAGAHIINVSGGEFSPSGEPYPLLAQVIDACARSGILIVAAAGNEGCDCLHVPASVDSVLAVGAMDARGEPLEFSNWGSKYQIQGVLAPGEQIAGAAPGSGWTVGSGTSYAAAVVSGVAALLLSLQRKTGQMPDALSVREAILKSAIGCDLLPSKDCRRLLAGRLNVKGALSFILMRNHTMPEPTMQSHEVLLNQQAAPTSLPETSLLTPQLDVPVTALMTPSGIQPAACATCQAAAAAKPQLVYALGQIGYDFTSEGRLDSVAQKMANGHKNGVHKNGVNKNGVLPRTLALDPKRMLAYLNQYPAEAACLEWTLNVDDTPIYAVRPFGPFAGQAYELLRSFLQQSLNSVERCSIPGVIVGKTRLLLGQEVPVIVPEVRAMYSWDTAALVKAVAGRPRANGSRRNGNGKHAAKLAGIQNFLHRIYHEHRNLGALPEHRAMNYAATNALDLDPIYEDALKENMELHNVKCTRSPIGRPGSDCWDVEIYFFRPQDQVANVKKVYRYTVDVSDIVPAIVGPVRSWYTT